MESKQEYTLGHHDGKPALFTARGLVCVFEAGYQQTREQDARRVCEAMNNALADENRALRAALSKNVAYLEFVTRDSEFTTAVHEALTLGRAALAGKVGAA